jgi:hypothetical protein
MSQPPKQSQLEEHTFQFAKAVRAFGKRIPNTVSNVEDLRELVRASGQVGAIYVRALMSGSLQHYRDDIRACGQQAQTTRYWLRLIDTQGHPELEKQRDHLIKAAQDLVNVFSHILKKNVA